MNRGSQSSDIYKEPPGGAIISRKLTSEHNQSVDIRIEGTPLHDKDLLDNRGDVS